MASPSWQRGQRTNTKKFQSTAHKANTERKPIPLVLVPILAAVVIVAAVDAVVVISGLLLLLALVLDIFAFVVVAACRPCCPR